MAVEFKRRWPNRARLHPCDEGAVDKVGAGLPGRVPEVSGGQDVSQTGPTAAPPPILIGAGGLGWKCERAIKDTVEWGDGWFPVVMSPAELARHLASMKELSARAGRDFAKIEVSMLFLQQPELQPQDPARAVDEYSRAGVHRMVLSPPALTPGRADAILEGLAKQYLG